MPLNSIPFLFFFLAAWVVHLALPPHRRSAWILAVSCVFYCLWDYRFVALVLLSATLDFWVARRMSSTESERARRLCLLLSLGVNLGILGIFKYYNFFLDGARTLLEWLGTDVSRWHLDLALPIGISFYTFKTLSYVIDVYRGEMRPARRWVDYAAYVAFFPQLMAGPIDRASALLPQMECPPRPSFGMVRAGCWLFLWGLFKKMVVADNLGGFVAPAFAAASPVSSAYAWTALYAFALQLYCDFSGYTDMARGAAMLLGFQTAINFRNPFFATNPIDFWQRWHISLSKWVQDYLYFPMATRALRKSTSAWNQYAPHVFTMILLGLWHGANATFVAFGLYWGLAIVIYNLYRAGSKRRRRRTGRTLASGPLPLGSPRRWVAMALFFHVVCFSFVFFRANSIRDAFQYFARLFDFRDGAWLAGGFGLDSLHLWIAIAALYGPVALMQIHQEIHGDGLSIRVMSPWPRIAWAVFAIWMLLVFANANGGDFIYARF